MAGKAKLPECSRMSCSPRVPNSYRRRSGQKSPTVVLQWSNSCCGPEIRAAHGGRILAESGTNWKTLGPLSWWYVCQLLATFEQTCLYVANVDHSWPMLGHILRHLMSRGGQITSGTCRVSAKLGRHPRTFGLHRPHLGRISCTEQPSANGPITIRQFWDNFGARRDQRGSPRGAWLAIVRQHSDNLLLPAVSGVAAVRSLGHFGVDLGPICDKPGGVGDGWGGFAFDRTSMRGVLDLGRGRDRGRMTSICGRLRSL